MNVFSIIVVLALAISTTAQQVASPKITKTSAKYTSPSSGKEMFDSYCASCHGENGKGNGPAAAAMKNGVPDLTGLAKSHDGKFPSFHVYEVIRGDAAIPAHGSAEMPVWGPVLRRVAVSDNAQLQQRLQNLTDYVRSLQDK
jgi:mono/diheme cytochrome c family protein